MQLSGPQNAILVSILSIMRNAWRRTCDGVTTSDVCLFSRCFRVFRNLKRNTLELVQDMFSKLLKSNWKPWMSFDSELSSWSTSSLPWSKNQFDRNLNHIMSTKIQKNLFFFFSSKSLISATRINSQSKEDKKVAYTIRWLHYYVKILQQHKKKDRQFRWNVRFID